MAINRKEYNLDKMFKKIENYCNEYDILCSYDIYNKTIKLMISRKLSKTLKTLKININDIELKLTDKLIYKYRYFTGTLTNNVHIRNSFLVNCINEVISEILKTKKILEIE